MKNFRPRKGEAQKASPLYFKSILIEKLIVGGAGMGRLPDGRVVFVPGTCPGDIVEVKVTLVKKNYAEGELVQLEKSSEHRIKPPCPVADQCGGCSWQHVSSAEQLRQKQMILADLLRKFLKDQAIEPDPIVPSPASFHYRNRIQPKIRSGKIGFFGKSSHDLIHTQECLIAEKPLSDLMSQLTDLAKVPHADLELYLDQNEEPRWKQLGDPSEAIGFSQVNRFQNKQLIEFVLEHSKGQNFRQIFDLYAGSGNFTFPLSKLYPDLPLAAVELSEKLVLRGLQQCQTEQVRFIQSDVGEFLKKPHISPEALVILDPPRAGCGIETMQALAKQLPKKIIYISCHPASLVRDLQVLLSPENPNQVKMKLTKIQAFEMFPQTDHFENIAVLSVDT